MDGHSAIGLKATTGRSLPRPGLIALLTAAAFGCFAYVGWSLLSGRSETIAPESFGVALDIAADAAPIPVPVPAESPPRARLTLDDSAVAADEAGVVNAHLEAGGDANVPELVPASFVTEPATARGAWLSGVIEPLLEGSAAATN